MSRCIILLSWMYLIAEHVSLKKTCAYGQKMSLLDYSFEKKQRLSFGPANRPI